MTRDELEKQIRTSRQQNDVNWDVADVMAIVWPEIEKWIDVACHALSTIESLNIDVSKGLYITPEILDTLEAWKRNHPHT